MLKPFDMTQANVRLFRNGTSEVVLDVQGPHGSVDGYVIGAPKMTRSPPHGGELHPDGDELLILLSGRVDVVLDDPDGSRSFELSAGQAFVVPKGVWHRVIVREPCHLLHITPGPGEDYRPVSGS